MSQDIKRYLTNAQIENQNRFAKEMEDAGNLSVDLWKSIITIHALIFGVSGGIKGYLGGLPNGFLISAWVLQIISIGLGFILLKLYVDFKSRSSFESFKFSTDMNEFLLKEADGEFIGNQDKMIGMFTAISINRLSDPTLLSPKKQIFTEQAKKLADQYKSQLITSKIFIEAKKTKTRTMWEFCLKNISKFINAFYIFSVLAFLALLLGILA